MESVTSDDGSDRYGGYSLSADVSEAETSGSFFCRLGGDDEGSYSSVSSSPLTTGFVDLCFHKPRAEFISRDKKSEGQMDFSESEMMKERFSKLLLGEDMSGSGKGVCTALALSNAITNLSASVFGELWRLEPLAHQKKSMWRREMEWFLSVSDSIVELVPTVQSMPGGGTYEVMASRPRPDLYINLPALKKLDAMLLNILDGFKETEFWYVDRGVAMVMSDGNDDRSFSNSSRRPSFRQEDKWWLPSPQVSPTGMSIEARKKLQKCRDCTNQILKAAMAINSCVLAEMDIPDVYLENLPKNVKSFLNDDDDDLYSCIASDDFNPRKVIDRLNFSSEHDWLEAVNRTETAMYAWRQKEQRKHSNQKSSKWAGKMKDLVTANEKPLLLAERAETLLHHIRLRFPGLPQTTLDMNKIQFNKDVGQAILESYSRVMESVAFNIMARIDDLLYVDDATKQNSDADAVSLFSRRVLAGTPVMKPIMPSPFSVLPSPYSCSPFSTPMFSGSSPLPGSPKKAVVDIDKVRSYTSAMSAMKVAGDVHERD